MSALTTYFDLNSNLKTKESKLEKAVEKSLHWLPQYIALVLGILLQPFIASFQSTSTWDFSGFTTRLLFSLLIGLMIFPSVYKNSFDQKSNLFVQLCIIFTAGIGWESLLKTVGIAFGI